VEIVAKKLIDYQTPDKECPFRRWLNDLDISIRVRIEARLKRVALGSLGDVKFVGEGVSEFRMTFGSGFRIYFGQQGNEVIILLCGGDKSSQSDDIKTAKTYWDDYKGRIKND
jgi:putative addiction module killer protein